MINSQRETAEMLEEIENLVCSSDLSQWEHDFLDSVSRQDKWTPKQREIIDRIYREKCQ